MQVQPAPKYHHHDANNTDFKWQHTKFNEVVDILMHEVHPIIIR